MNYDAVRMHCLHASCQGSRGLLTAGCHHRSNQLQATDRCTCARLTSSWAASAPEVGAVGDVVLPSGLARFRSRPARFLGFRALLAHGFLACGQTFRKQQVTASEKDFDAHGLPYASARKSWKELSDRATVMKPAGLRGLFASCASQTGC